MNFEDFCKLYPSINEDDFYSLDEEEGFTCVRDTEIEDQDRWHTYKSAVFQNKEDGKFWRQSWREGSTEYQECDANFSFVEVVPIQVFL